MKPKHAEPTIDLPKIYRELAKKYDLDLWVVSRICNSMFEYTKQCIKEQDYNNVYIPFIGSFQPKAKFKNIKDAI